MPFLVPWILPSRSSLVGLAIALALTGTALPVRADENSLRESLINAAEPLLSYALDLIGAPYKFGGEDPETGVDCSGYVRHVYKQTADIELPRSARQISTRGDEVAPENLKPGDLVFFNTMRKSFSHVGIYTGNNQFVHAASSRTGSVTVSNLKDGYWARRFDGARRILPSTGLE